MVMTRAGKARKEGVQTAQDAAQNEPALEVENNQRLKMSCHLRQVNWNRKFFENFNCNILAFASDFINLNKARGITVTFKTTVGYWNQLVWRLYGDGNVTSNRLESQVYQV